MDVTFCGVCLVFGMHKNGGKIMTIMKVYDYANKADPSEYDLFAKGENNE